MPLRLPFQSDFSLSPSLSLNIFPTMRPIAGELVSPGDSIPAQSKNPGASSTQFMINS